MISTRTFTGLRGFAILFTAITIGGEVKGIPGLGAAPPKAVQTTASGLGYVHQKVGSGTNVIPGHLVAVHYRGSLDDGTEFDSSYKRKQPFLFVVGQGRVIPGWDEGLQLVRPGGTIKLIIPPQLGYGNRAVGPIPANSRLTFIIELVAVYKSPAPPPAGKINIPTQGKKTLPGGLVYYDLKVGQGQPAQSGKIVIVHYKGQLPNGQDFDASWRRQEPLNFPLGKGIVIPGWDQGVVGMKPGGRRILVIPPELGYGQKGAGGVIPPNATLIFVIDYMGSL